MAKPTGCRNSKGQLRKGCTIKNGRTVRVRGHRH